MFLDLFYRLRAAGIPVTPSDHLDLLHGIKLGIGRFGLDELFQFARMTLVKDERQFDRFGQVFEACLKDSRANGSAGDPGRLRDELLALLGAGGDAAEGHIIDQATIDRLVASLCSDAGVSAARPLPGRLDPEAFRRAAAAPAVPPPAREAAWRDRSFAGVEGSRQITPATLHLALRRLRGFGRTVTTAEIDVPATVAQVARADGATSLVFQTGRRAPVRLLVLVAGGEAAHRVSDTWRSLLQAFRGEFRNIYLFDVLAAAGGGLHFRQADITGRPRVFDAVRLAGAFPAAYRVIGLGPLPPGARELAPLVRKYRAVAWMDPTFDGAARQRRPGQVPHGHAVLGGHVYPLSLDGLDHAISALQ
ncbi:MAG: hypothetical protein H6843_08240 [Rhodospirillaceae bacterium]|nr:hypothetical protein [Rhodospirillaceae bacterium]